MQCATNLGRLLSVIFQTTPALFQSFFRHGFGRRGFPLFSSLFAPLFILALAVAIRHFMPHQFLYAPLRILPPFGSWPENRALMASTEMGLPRIESTFFAAFALLFVLFAIGHFVALRIACLRKRDPVNTRFFGNSWFHSLPGISGLRVSRVHSVVEPLALLISGYALCALVPVFGMYLMAGGLVLCVEQSLFWRRVKLRELDTRDAYVGAQIEQGYHDRAQQFMEASEKRARTGAVSAKTLARVQTNPHALLALSEAETEAVRQTLGPDEFGELVDHLPEEAQNVIYSRLAGFKAVRTPEPKSA